MKCKISSLITVSLATSVLLAPTPEAFSHSVKSQTNLHESQPLVFDVESDKGVNTSKSSQSLVNANISQTNESSQSNLVDQTAQVTNALAGSFVTSMFIGYILIIIIQYRKRRTHRATVLLQQIETLERIWKLNSKR